MLWVAALIYCCQNNSAPVIATHASGDGFTGPERCQNCHKSIYDSHLEMAHYSTSALFNQSKVILDEREISEGISLNDSLEYHILNLDGILNQEARANDSVLARKPFHVTIGSGKRGQTFLYWEDDFLYQLPVSRYADVWVNSPGYPTDTVRFERPIDPSCLECHTTHATSQQDLIRFAENKYVKEKMLWGITCERCHGPGKKHVDFHEQNPDSLESREITRYVDLSRKQKLDACALCHSGFRNRIREDSEFSVGDDLAQYSNGTAFTDNAESIDVHGNQYGLLVKSKCFLNSADMDCSSCHDTHKNEVANLSMFSAKCMTCHQQDDEVDCGKFESMGRDISNNCIDCHMPSFTTKNIKITNPENKEIFETKMRTHKIGVYEKDLDEILEYIETLN